MKARVKSFEMTVATLMRAQIMGKINTSGASKQLPLQTAMKKKKRNLTEMEQGEGTITSCKTKAAANTTGRCIRQLFL